MRTPHLLLLAAAFLIGCDQRGTPPTGNTGTIGLGGTTGGTPGGTKDTGKPVAVDTTSASLNFDSAQLAGQPGQNAFVPGSAREALFFLAGDASMHVIASSDGASPGSAVGRETVWDIVVRSKDSLAFNFVSRPTDQGLIDSFGVGIDSSGTVRQNVVVVRVYSIASAPEMRIASVPGAALNVTVVARSDFPPSGPTAGWLPPLLAGTTTANLIKFGQNQTPAGVVSFTILMPGGKGD